MTLALSSSRIDENGGETTVMASLDGPSTAVTRMTVKVVPQGLAVAGDYSLSANKELTVAAGSMTSTGTVTISAVNNGVFEGDKTVSVRAEVTSNASGVTGPDNVPLTIREDERGPQLSIDDLSVQEGASGNRISEMVFTVTLDPEAVQQVTVDYETDEQEGLILNYRRASGTLSFSPGEVEKTITVEVIDDDLAELDETFNVVLSNPTFARLGKSTGTGTILNDDLQVMTVEPVRNTAAEGEEVSFRVSREADNLLYKRVQWRRPSR